MPGPCSQPDGPKSRWEELNEIVCNTHFVCWEGKGELKQFYPCELLTYREWLIKRNKLRTGKTL
jgi:hypothetical protein